MSVDRALQLLADMTKCRLNGDATQRAMVDMKLDYLDADGGYLRRGARRRSAQFVAIAERRSSSEPETETK